jgi:hypothetical protein
MHFPPFECKVEVRHENLNHTENEVLKIISHIIRCFYYFIKVIKNLFCLRGEGTVELHSLFISLNRLECAKRFKLWLY